MTRSLNNWPLQRKMMAAFAVIALSVIGLGIKGLLTNTQLATIADRHVSRGLTGVEALGRVSNLLREHRMIVMGQTSATTPEIIRSYDERFAQNKIVVQKAIADFEAVAGELTPEVEILKKDVARVEALNERIFALQRSGGSAASLPLSTTDGKTVSRTAIDQAEKLVTLARKRANEANVAGAAASETAFYWTGGIVLAMLAALFAIWRFLGTTVARPLAEVSHVTKLLAEGGKADVPHRDRGDELGEVANAVELFRQAAISRAEADARTAAEQQIVTTELRNGLSALTSGDLTAEIKVEFPADYAGLKTNYNDALAALRDLIGAVSESAASIRTGSNEIAHASEDLARRTEGNAASLEETSAALVQIDGRLKATAVASARTVERADQAIATVGGGRAIADEAVQAMGRVSDSAKGIDSVIEGLDKIAFQTRVLAMNAAVEAGRAGDAGRGFAVVADLVSALAMRAEEEAKRARDQLTVTQGDIVTAVEAVQKVDGALADISGDVGQVHELLGTMAADNQAQSSAITQITAAVSTMDQSTQQNAAMVEETSAAARNLTSEVTALAEQSARFKTENGARSPSARSEPIVMKTKPAAKNYVSPVKPLPAAAVAALVRTNDDDWKAF